MSETRNLCNCPNCSTADCPAGRDNAALKSEIEKLRDEKRGALAMALMYHKQLNSMEFMLRVIEQNRIAENTELIRQRDEANARADSEHAARLQAEQQLATTKEEGLARELSLAQLVGVQKTAKEKAEERAETLGKACAEMRDVADKLVTYSNPRTTKGLEYAATVARLKGTSLGRDYAHSERGGASPTATRRVKTLERNP